MVVHRKEDSVQSTVHTETRAHLNHLDDGARDGGGGALGVVAPRDDPVEELAALAELHDEVHVVLVLAARRLTMFGCDGMWRMISTSRRTSSTSTGVRSFRFDIDLHAYLSPVSASVHRTM
uniref:Uncharacterized protein n=1 Tax=Oryza glumipatula TaxID=40148 RepID=A0A0D9ZES0_9ORYZ